MSKLENVLSSIIWKYDHNSTMRLTYICKPYAIMGMIKYKSDFTPFNNSFDVNQRIEEVKLKYLSYINLEN